MNTVLDSFTQLVSSSIGRKWVVAVTGLMLLVFLAVHMAGNLLIFLGADAFNGYAYKLHSLLYGYGIWVARLGLLAVFGLHIAFTLLLVRDNKKARPGGYQFEKTVQAKSSTKLMMISGLVILSFLIYHILHFTVKAGNEYSEYKTLYNGKEVHDAYRMVITGFLWIPAVIFYLIGMVLLCSHLHHGVSSVFQTLGLRTRKNAALIEWVGKIYALVIFLGFVSVPLAVQLRLVPSDVTIKEDNTPKTTEVSQITEG